jgi:hypothetical protein
MFNSRKVPKKLKKTFQRLTKPEVNQASLITRKDDDEKNLECIST